MNLPRVSLANLEKLLFFGAISLLPTQIGKHFFPDFSFVYSLKIDYYSPTLYGWDLLVIALFLVRVFNKRRFNSLSIGVFLFFILTQSLSLFGASNMEIGLVRIKDYLIAGMFGIIVSSLDYNFWPSLKLGFIIASLYTSFIGLGQFLFSKSLGFWILGERNFTINTLSIANFNFYGKVFLRPYSTFPHPNVFAAFLVISNILLSRHRGVFGGIAKTINSVMCVLTFSRSGILLLFGHLVYLMRGKLKILLVLFLIALPFLFVRFYSAFNFDSLSVIRREELASIAIEQFWKNPLFGIGLNNFILDSATSSLVSGPSRFLQPVHNIYLLSLAETGLVGILGFVCLFWFGRRGIRMMEVQMCLYAILFLGFFDHYFLTLAAGQRLFFLIWGLMYVKPKLDG